MKITLTCPKNPQHRHFCADATVVQLWEVDSTGEFIRVLDACQDVVRRPESHDVYTCRCGAKAEVSNERAPVMMKGVVVPATADPAPIVPASHPRRQKPR